MSDEFRQRVIKAAEGQLEHPMSDRDVIELTLNVLASEPWVRDEWADAVAWITSEGRVSDEFRNRIIEAAAERDPHWDDLNFRHGVEAVLDVLTSELWVRFEWTRAGEEASYMHDEIAEAVQATLKRDGSQETGLAAADRLDLEVAPVRADRETRRR